MFGEGRPIIYDAPADLKKWPSLNGQRLNGGSQPYLVFNGRLANCIRELLAKPLKGISLYDIVTDLQPAFDRNVLSPGDAAEIAMRQDFPKAEPFDGPRRTGQFPLISLGFAWKSLLPFRDESDR